MTHPSLEAEINKMISVVEHLQRPLPQESGHFFQRKVKEMTVEKPILDTIREFVNQLEDIEKHKTGSGLELSLAVKLPGRYDNEGPPTIKLEASFYDGAHHQTCKAASLDSLMSEVKRRLGFEDREAVRLQTLEQSFKALPAPRTFDEHIVLVERPKRFGEV